MFGESGSFKGLQDRCNDFVTIILVVGVWIMATKTKTITPKGKAGSAKRKPQRQKAPRSTLPKKATRRRRKTKDPLTREVIGIGYMAVGVLSGVSLFLSEKSGFIGGAAQGILTGFFGLGAYILPFVVTALGALLLFSKRMLPRAKRAQFGVLFLCVITFADFFSKAEGEAVSFDSFAGYLSAYYQAGSVYNGGLVGAIFNNFFHGILGGIGTCIVLVALAVAMTILLTGRSFYDLLAVGLAWTHSFWKEDPYEDYDEDEEFLEEAFSERPASKIEVSQPERRKKNIPFYTIEETAEVTEGKPIQLFDQKGGGKLAMLLKRQGRRNILEEMTLPETERLETASRSHGEKLSDHMEVAEAEALSHKAMVLDEEKPPEGEREIFIETNNKKQQGDEVSIVIHEKMVDPAKRESKQLPGPEQTDNESENLTEALQRETPGYVFPPIHFLNQNPVEVTSSSRAQILENSKKLEDTLKSFGVEAKVVEVSKGPTVTRYELSPGQGVKVSKISNLADDLALNLAATGIRIEAPIPGKAAVGIEVPNKEVTPVYLREVLEEELFQKFPSRLAFGLGKDIAGNTVVADIAKMPHLLIAGATGSGKSVCVNTLITSILYKANPDDVKLLMVDPKVVELGIYNGIPHLLIPVVTDPKKAAGALNWAVQEMIHRYNLFAETSVRDLSGYNAMCKENSQGKPLPQIVIIIDELADLMMAAPGEVEDAICRLAQMARAAGLHLIIATQRPSVDVITGLIKANIPSRLAFSVSSGTDSRTILDAVGAEKLLGKGDMLFYPVGMSKPLRVQGAFVSDKEVETIVNFVKRDAAQEYDQEMIETITAAKTVASTDEELDEFFEDAMAFVVHKEKASASMLQRQFRIGYNRAARLIEVLENKGIVGPEDGSKPRKVLMSAYELEEYRKTKSLNSQSV